MLTLEEIKTHLRVDVDDDAQNEELEGFLLAAKDYCENYINGPLIDSENPSLNPSIRAAMLLIIGDLYENREGRFVGTIQTNNPMLVNLLHFHRKGLGV